VYEIQWSDEAEADLVTLSVFQRPRVVAAVERLRYEAEVETRNRKPLERILDQLPAARWNLRVGDLRVFYRIVGGPAVQILRVILKGTSTTDEALARSVKP
jgi:mRNA-degrading endonuclease RelE of RelBE toxin-antitoxin system